ncbi:CheY-like receiver and HD-GYP domain-containing response regulator [Desulfocapsa sulfexigens DSM 10523]|uniref:CheY-like receiver and HD-GYP domain-containing response regulator n=2 Tax=Desulfocapsa TaxID=53318 RepID=M1PRU6_DESSD|nr:CheY-like receiver and HD-GYP domain-containing response regulator [Desulfocapsa sulfexigens DSM 10523]
MGGSLGTDFKIKKRQGCDMETTTRPDTNTVNSVLEIIRSLNQLKGMDMILDRILFESRKLANADAGSIYLVKNDTLVFNHVQNDTLFGRNGAGAAQYAKMTLPIDSHTIVGYCAQTKQTVSIDDAYQIPATVPYSFNPSFDEENNYHTASSLTIPLLTSNDSLVGVIQLINAQNEQGQTSVFSERSKTMACLFANSASMIIEHGILNRETILRMVKMASLHDPKETGAHVQRVSAFSVEIYQRWAKKKGLPDSEINHFRDLISLAAMTHDAGKVGISDIILKKPARLTKDEFNIIKKHTTFGAELFNSTSTELDKMTHEVTLHHHQKWNGTGYPNLTNFPDKNSPNQALAGKDIPLAARIVALADVFDALSSSRCYKEPWEKEKVYNLIQKESGEHFDPELVQAFFEITDVLCAIQEKFQ